MKSKTIPEMRSIAKNKNLRGYQKLKKGDFLASLLKQSAKEMRTPLPSSNIRGLHDIEGALKCHLESNVKKENHEEEGINLTPH